METMKAIARRRSVRSFEPQRQVAGHDLDAIVAAACAAPVAAKDYGSLHLTVVQEKSALNLINENTRQALNTEKDFLYNAPALVIVSAAAEQKFPNIQYANTGCIMENMLLAATDLGLGSIYLWAAAVGLAKNQELCTKLGIPQGFTPISAAGLGYSSDGAAVEKELTISLSTNYI